MSGWLERQVDAWCDRRIDPYVNKKLDSFLKGKMPDENFAQLKAMTRKGQPLDVATEARLRGQPSDAFEPYKKVHAGVARLERIENTVNKVARILP